jgi:hypothetical protein
VTGPDAAGQIEAWSGYPLQFGGQRRFAWQDEMAADLRQALAGLPITPGTVLAGTYASTDPARCDVENRLFTNLGGASFPKSLAGSGSSAIPACRRLRRSRLTALRGTCTTTATASAGHGNRGSLPRRWPGGTG